MKMSNMDQILNSKMDKLSIYEIYRACRLCGGGAGYKMPIIQNIVDLDVEGDVELKQKIRDCVQIEVHQDDKMPPLICELCVDKVNDFYEFLEMCRQTNKRTRLRLGLPPQSLPRGAPDAGDCILGLTEPVFVNEDSDGEPLSKHKKLKSKVKKEPIVRIKLENLQDDLLTRHQVKRPPTPPRVTRHSKSRDDDVARVKHKDNSKSNKMAPKSILKKENSAKSESTTELTARLKRYRDKDPVKLDTSNKKVKITINPLPPPKTKSPKSSTKLSPRLHPKVKPSRQLRSPPITPPKRQATPPREEHTCNICGQQNKTRQARSNHMRSHTVGFTNVKLACNPCEDWFPTFDDYISHHKNHKAKHIPYNCNKCQADFKRLMEYDEHLANNDCLPSTEVPDVQCAVCWQYFATNNLLDQHRCLGEDYRPGGKCNRCSRTYSILKNLRKHESTCTARKKGELVIDKALLDKLRPIQIRVARCDPLLRNVKQEHFDVSNVTSDYGLDTNCYYPYISGLRIKSEYPAMVDIQDSVKAEFCSQDYIHWDSDESEDNEISCDDLLNRIPKRKSVDSLSALTLKTIFSQRFLGKVPKKKRKLKVEKVFDSMLCENDDVSVNIGNIIDNLRDDDNDRTCDSNNVNDSVMNSVDSNLLDGNNDSMNDVVNDSCSLVSNNDNDKSDVVSFNDSSNKVDDNSLLDVNESRDSVKNNDEVLINNSFDDVLENLNQDTNSQSLLDNDYFKRDNSKSLLTDDQKETLSDSNAIDNNSNSDSSKMNSQNDSIVSKVDSKETNLESNNAVSNDSIEFRLSKLVDRNDSIYNNDSKYNNDRSLLEELDSQMDDSNVDDKECNNDSNDDKIVLEDLISKSNDTKIGLGSIEEYSFDS